MHLVLEGKAYGVIGRPQANMEEPPKRPPDSELADSDIERVAGGKKSPERTVKQSGSHTDSSGNTYTCSEKTGIATRIQVNDKDVVIGEEKHK